MARITAIMLILLLMETVYTLPEEFVNMIDQLKVVEDKIS